MKKALLPLLLLVTFVAISPAEEGMWLFNAVPKDKIKAAYGFEPSNTWLDHVRLSSVRFPNGSGSFVSADGLVFTNHHVGARCVQELSKSGGADYMKNGFYAKTQLDEQKCPNLELIVLQSIDDVTAKVNAAVQPNMSSADVSKAQRAAMTAIEKDCHTSTGLRCDVVSLYSGGMYHLYRYKKYTDVRLVFAPEFQMAFFGGDEDNFTFPRYDLDITFFRAYENNKPAVIKDYLVWSRNGIKDGDPIFVSGHPGSTGRWLTEAQRNFLRDTDYPFKFETYKCRIEKLKAFGSQSAENGRLAREPIFGLENSLKATKGYNVGLQNKEVMARYAADEQKLRQLVLGDSKREVEIGDPWSAIARAMETHKKIYMPYTFFEKRGGLRNDLGSFARDLVRLAAEKPKANADRLREYRDSALDSLEQDLFTTAPVYETLEVRLLTTYLEQMKEHVTGADAAFVEKLLAGKSPDKRAEELIAGTKLDDVDYRRKLYEGGQAAIDASDDTLIAFMRELDPEARKFRKVYDDEVDAVEKREGAKIAKLKFELEGLKNPPDATFTLRLSYGSVKSYKENGKTVAPFTTMGQAFEYASNNKAKADHVLPASWDSSRRQLNPRTPLNFVSTADIIGGNSGSPVVDKNAEVVGIIFDGNIQSLPWRYYFEGVQGRAVAVDARGIQESLRAIYNAKPLAEELINGKIVSDVQTNVGK
ncbi:MAG TPA: S46 family peptidase [Terriglobales bacterium]|nr:S46 family peptidase [Terriglobales bacterium]